MKTPARVRTNGFLSMTLMLTASCWGCGVTAEIEMIQGQIGSPDADIQVFEVKSSSSADCRRGVTYLAMESWSNAAQAFQLALAADQFIVSCKRDESAGNTIIAGYPWFTDWGRDTMIALPGLTLCTGRFDVGREILGPWARHVDRGMI
ncbi:MAG: hypothetical protein IID05_12605, partial [Gemmatimonadetes bacterium]|nr:hypothetical protein [Gemmatimonadota bacterium]